MEAGQEAGGMVGREAGNRLGFEAGWAGPPSWVQNIPDITLGASPEGQHGQRSGSQKPSPFGTPEQPWEKEAEWLPPDTFLVSQPECFLKKVANPCFTKVSWWPGMNGSIC